MKRSVTAAVNERREFTFTDIANEPFRIHVQAGIAKRAPSVDARRAAQHAALCAAPLALLFRLVFVRAVEELLQPPACSQQRDEQDQRDRDQDSPHFSNLLSI
jgi:hypothetical protein